MKLSEEMRNDSKKEYFEFYITHVEKLEKIIEKQQNIINNLIDSIKCIEIYFKKLNKKFLK